jgi:hypothetical protein
VARCKVAQSRRTSRAEMGNGDGAAARERSVIFHQSPGRAGIRRLDAAHMGAVNPWAGSLLLERRSGHGGADRPGGDGRLGTGTRVASCWTMAV